MTKSKEELMDEAVALGLEPHPNTGEAKLQLMINEKLMASEEVTVEPEVEINPKKLNAKERRAILRKRQLKLTRIVLRSNDARDKEQQGATIQVICAAGTIKKYIPFDNEDGWHVPQCILKRLQEKLCLQFKNGKLRNGQKVRLSYEGKKYNVEILPDLTLEEIKTLGADQSARGGLD